MAKINIDVNLNIDADQALQVWEDCDYAIGLRHLINDTLKSMVSSASLSEEITSTELVVIRKMYHLFKKQFDEDESTDFSLTD